VECHFRSQIRSFYYTRSGDRLVMATNNPILTAVDSSPQVCVFRTVLAMRKRVLWGGGWGGGDSGSKLKLRNPSN